ncbi:UNVERIFIED_CONTAM: GTPase CgtA, partial [Mumia flava]
SAASHEGLAALSYAMAEVVASTRRTVEPAPARRIVLSPPSADGGDDFSVVRQGEMWRVTGEKPERWVRQTDFTNDEAVGFLADRLARLGVEARLLELGAAAGEDVVIGSTDDAVVFDFDPQVVAGAELLGSRRGEDERLVQNHRRTTKERREALAARREHERVAREERERTSAAEDLWSEEDEDA